MKKHQLEDGTASDPIAKKAVELAGAVAERSQMNKELLTALAMTVGTNEKTQRKFRTAVLIRLSRIETMLTEVQGAQLVQFWPPDRVQKDQQTRLVQEVQDRVDRSSRELVLKMVNYIYGEGVEPEKSGAVRFFVHVQSDG
jgi:hypothetical protein